MRGRVEFTAKKNGLVERKGGHDAQTLTKTMKRICPKIRPGKVGNGSGSDHASRRSRFNKR